MARLCPECLGRGFVYSPGGYAPRLECPVCFGVGEVAKQQPEPRDAPQPPSRDNAGGGG